MMNFEVSRVLILSGMLVLFLMVEGFLAVMIVRSENSQPWERPAIKIFALSTVIAFVPFYAEVLSGDAAVVGVSCLASATYFAMVVPMKGIPFSRLFAMLGGSIMVLMASSVSFGTGMSVGITFGTLFLLCILRSKQLSTAA